MFPNTTKITKPKKFRKRTEENSRKSSKTGKNQNGIRRQRKILKKMEEKADIKRENSLIYKTTA